MTCQADYVSPRPPPGVPEWSQRPHTLMLPADAPSGSLHMTCHSVGDEAAAAAEQQQQPAWALTNPVPHPLGQFTTTTTTTTIGLTAYDYQRLYENVPSGPNSSVTTPHVVNRMQPGVFRETSP